jgi:hypothetical protein
MDDPTLYQTIAERSTEQEVAVRAQLRDVLGFYRHDLAEGLPEREATDAAVKDLIEIIDRQIALAIDRAMNLMERKRATTTNSLSSEVERLEDELAAARKLMTTLGLRR